MNYSPSYDGKQACGFALVSTLLVLSVLTIMVVAFMQSMRVDHLTSRAYLNKTKAEFAADAGTAAAMARLRRLPLSRPYHSIGYQSISGQIVPVFYGSASASATPTASYLISSYTPDTAPATFSSANSVDINSRPGRPGGWIGSPIVNGAFSTTTCKAYWINIPQNPALPNQPDSSLPNYNPIVARYAYWIEDETSKIDYTVTGNKDGGGGTFLRSAFGQNVSDIDTGALPLLNKAPLSTTTTAIALNNRFFETRSLLSSFPMDFGLIDRLAYPDSSSDIYDDVKFHATPFSLSNELSGSGRRRVNLNNIVTNVTSATLNASQIISADLDDIVFAISGKHPFAGLNNTTHQGVLLDQPSETGLIPDFGKRFYLSPAMPAPNGTLKGDHELTYLLRIAANIRDYIDTDSVPTLVSYSGTVFYGSQPSLAWRTGEEPVALGKEAVPYLQEHAWRAYQAQYTTLPNLGAVTNRRQISFYLDHYFEFYNPTTKDYVAPVGSQISVYNRLTFKAGTAGPPVLLPDFTLTLTGVVFPAGQAVVVTTCPGDVTCPDPAGLLQSSNVVRITPSPATSRIFNNIICNEPVGSSPTRYGLQMTGRTSTSTDYRTEMLWTVPDGYIDSHAFLAVTADFSLSYAADTSNTTRFVFATNLRGNDAVSRSGEPRSMSEPLTQNAGSNAAYGNDQARFFASITGGGTAAVSVPNTSSFGVPANPTFVLPGNWSDYHITLTNSAGNAFALVADAPMKSIGELGAIYDPHRKLSPEAAATIYSARGGGRTLKIGQPDDLVSGNRFTASNSSSVGWFNAAWRICDVFCTETSSTVLEAATKRGKLNINGVLRDNGTAFRALLRSFVFSSTPTGDSVRASKTMSDTEINNLVSQLCSYLNTNGPMLERGELSQLSFFSDTSLAGQAQSSTCMDRCREEIFRRIAELITTRSASFSVYCIGESVLQSSSGQIQSLARTRKRVVFTLTPDLDDTPWKKPTTYTRQIYASQID